MPKNPDLRTCRWDLQFGQTILNAADESVDVFYLYDDGHSAIVSLGVPHGREDIAEFVFKCILAGQKLLKEMPKDMPFGPHLGARETYRNAVRRAKKATTKHE